MQADRLTISGKLPFMIAMLFYLCFLNEQCKSQDQQAHMPFQNSIKINLASLPIKNYSVAYERRLMKHISFQSSFRYGVYHSFFATRLGGKLMSVMEIDPDDQDIFRSFKIGNSSFTTDLKFFLNRRKELKGLYVGIYGRYAFFDMDNLGYSYETYTRDKYEVPLVGNLKAVAGGLLFGGQFNLGKRISVDLVLLSAHYGNLNGTVISKKDLSGLSESDKAALQNELNDFSLLKKKYIDVEVNENGLMGTINGPFFGTRMGNISVGYKF